MINLIFAVLLAATETTTGMPVKVVNADAGVKNAKITSASVYYDRKEGFAYFSGKVHVDDEKYQLHADRAYVFMNDTNELKRVVAIGHVAMTNENRRAYGEKVSYYRNPGMVVLSAGDKGAAEVREETPDGVRVVRGKKIKFWTGSDQVEVIQPDIEAKGMSMDVKGVLGR